MIWYLFYFNLQHYFNLFSISCRASLVVINSFNFSLSGSVLIASSLLRDSFSIYSILSWVFSFSTSNTSVCLVLASVVSDKKSEYWCVSSNLGSFWPQIVSLPFLSFPSGSPIMCMFGLLINVLYAVFTSIFFLSFSSNSKFPLSYLQVYWFFLPVQISLWVSLMNFFFRAAPSAYGSSQARGWIGAAAASLHHSHSNARSELSLWPARQLMTMLNPY